MSAEEERKEDSVVWWIMVATLGGLRLLACIVCPQQAWDGEYVTEMMKT